MRETGRAIANGRQRELGRRVLGYGLAGLGAAASACVLLVAWVVCIFLGMAFGVVSDAAPDVGEMAVGAVAGLAGGLVATLTAGLSLRLVTSRDVGVFPWLVLGGWVLLGACGTGWISVVVLCVLLPVLTLVAIAGRALHVLRTAAVETGAVPWP
ncbi:hypothetical protein [Myxococcus sp. Y35]|uniref:hypothetical protein n=1 Tax=Pseudomyxococcus flavus TaxID=3115648 RepID=UPI003CE7FA87